MYLRDIYDWVTILEAKFLQYLPPSIAVHVLHLLALILCSAILYFTLASLSYLFVWPHILLSHPKYSPKSRLRPVAQHHREISQSFWTVMTVSILVYPALIRIVDQCGTDGLNTVTWEEAAKTAGSLWVSYDFGGYLMHRFFHSNEFVFNWVHQSAHWWIVPTPFGTFALTPLDLLWRLVIPILVVPLISPVNGQLLVSMVTGLLFLNILIQDSPVFCQGPLSCIFQSRSHRGLHVQSTPYTSPYHKLNLHINLVPNFRKEFTHPVNFAPLTTLPDRLFFTYRAPDENDDQVRQAEVAVEAARKSKEVVGIKERRAQKGGWSKVDKFVDDGAGMLQTVRAKDGLAPKA
ncbi:hypothetical protein JAAARDRAFT_189031 [Jaapia argillacea MUCL 33604]|uniref:Fatty acid hydroxylase domain-containing protein n=1 Tax=Jaapia argillacea MUCL 33604 TaxID=933084 RepID=A0A067QBF6_9AGAM|nr:hypothetical protein JAAARDRAFT_189031 [Jaapia argillacea MUCL 33604]